MCLGTKNKGCCAKSDCMLTGAFLPKSAQACPSLPKSARACPSLLKPAQDYQNLPESARVCQSLPKSVLAGAVASQRPQEQKIVRSKPNLVKCFEIEHFQWRCANLTFVGM
jgi:hypothetical protein